MKLTLLLACLVALAAAGPAVAANPRVALETSKGRIVIELFPDKAPKTVANFLQYVRSAHYDGTIFHRVIDGFMVQGGAVLPDMRSKPCASKVENEADNGLKNDRGTVAMARTDDPHSASCQFFINVVDNAFLNHTAKTPQGWGYTVFGKVVEGMSAADAIAKVKTGSKAGANDVPLEPVVITKATLLAAE
jgi:cyclophilin family peptidyl-prolyl cis-trans isomerase